MANFAGWKVHIYNNTYIYKTMRQIVLVLAAVMLVFVTMTACAKRASKVSTESSATDGKRILVAYFSATGTTEAVARQIAKATGGKLYKITPVEAYTAADLDWTVPTSRSCRENDDPKSRPAIVKDLADLDSYDVIYLGYPNWWNMAPRIINTFVETYGLKGKTVIPFMTSGGSKIANSVRLLRSAYPDVKWSDGRLLNHVSQQEIDSWVKEAK